MARCGWSSRSTTMTRRCSPTCRCMSSSTRRSRSAAEASTSARMAAAGWPGTWVRERLGYEPRDEALFRTALTHRSAAGPNNERLEFLGDAVLNLLIAHRLYEAFPRATEGELSRL